VENGAVDAPEHDPLDDQDDIYSALSLQPEGWTLRSSEDGAEVPVSRDQVAQLLRDCKRMSAGLAPEGPEFYPDR
jgi:hypothetical protein